MWIELIFSIKVHVNNKSWPLFLFLVCIHNIIKSTHSIKIISKSLLEVGAYFPNCLQKGVAYWEWVLIGQEVI